MISTLLMVAILGLATALFVVSPGERTPAHSEKSKEIFMTPSPDNGIVTIAAHHSVQQTVEKLEGILKTKGVKLFVLVDHSGEAEKVGLKMPPTKLLIFGNPKAGTPLMLASPSMALDLPMKILVWEDTSGKVWISYNSVAYLQARHRLPPDLAPNISVVAALASSAAE